MKNRAEIDEKYKWNTKLIYKDEAEFNADFEKAEKLTESFGKFEKSMLQSAENLYNTLLAATELDMLISKIYEYAHLNSDVDTSDNHFLALSGKAENLFTEAGAASYFVLPNLIKPDDEQLDKWYEEFPKLREFKRNIDVQRRYKPYTMGDSEEKLLAEMQNCLSSHESVRDVLSYSDIKFGEISNEKGEKVRLTDTNYIPLMMSESREVRKSAFETLYKTYSQFGNTYAGLINGFVKEKVTQADIRGYKNSLEASVFDDEVSSDIYTNLIDTVSSDIGVIYDYYALKKEALGLNEIHMYDIYAPLVNSVDKKYTYDEACEIVLDALKVFGSEYISVLKSGLSEKRWVDVYPNTGKKGGAYSAGCYGVQPYILLNFNGTLEDVSTLAHEGGHSMHTWLSNRANTPQQAGYTIFVAEVASTVNELLLAHKMLRESQDSEEKKYILNQLMETYKGTLYRQTMFAEFERDIHNLCSAGEILTSDVLCDKYYKLNKKYFGDNVVLDDEIKYEWMRIPHFYYNFYVYKYATCISAASSIVKNIETQGDKYVVKYLEFLSCGGSLSPLESLKKADIDMREPQVVKNAIDDFKDVIEQFKSLI